MKLLSVLMERLVSFGVGTLFAGASLYVSLWAVAAEGWLKSALGLVCLALICLTVYWWMVPREAERRWSLEQKRVR